MSHFFLARQPIFDRALRVHAYELLFRDSWRNANALEGLDDDATTARVISNAADVGLEKLTRNRLAFINLPQRFLEDPDLIPLDPAHVVLEILETVTVNEASIAGIHALRGRGFRLALDDFADTTAFDAILPLVDIVKLDVRALPPARWHSQVERLASQGCRVLAEKVETRKEYDDLRRMNVDYFQGYFFARPRVVRGRQLPPGRINLLQVLARLNDPESGIDEVNELVSRDVALSVRALNYANSAANAPAKKIESIREAVVYLGRDTIRRWVSLYLLVKAETRPSERLTLALQRAKVCELIAERSGRDDAEACFTVGLFSMLDVMLDAPLPEVLKHLQLSEQMRAALLEHAGDKGSVLDCALRFETGDVEAIACLSLTPEDLDSLYRDAVRWTDDALLELGIS